MGAHGAETEGVELLADAAQSAHLILKCGRWEQLGDQHHCGAFQDAGWRPVGQPRNRATRRVRRLVGDSRKLKRA
jgi:hypothetical protein